MPMLSFASTSAPKWIKSTQAGARPTPAMKWSGVRPLLSSMFGLAPILSASSRIVMFADCVPWSSFSSSGEIGSFAGSSGEVTGSPFDSAGGGVFVRTLIETEVSTSVSATAGTAAAGRAPPAAFAFGFLILIFTLLPDELADSEQTGSRARNTNARPLTGAGWNTLRLQHRTPAACGTTCRARGSDAHASSRISRICAPLCCRRRG
mmetsp:Transcript_19906/g.42851  ORF Transcript_19906/g.42851 Transcript_19906/m.42851 type:complete len:207 (+) Transcript_19906:664-1284(+)